MKKNCQEREDLQENQGISQMGNLKGKQKETSLFLISDFWLHDDKTWCCYSNIRLINKFVFLVCQIVDICGQLGNCWWGTVFNCLPAKQTMGRAGFELTLLLMLIFTVYTLYFTLYLYWSRWHKVREPGSSIGKDLIDSKDPKHTLFCRETAFVAIYAFFEG